MPDLAALTARVHEQIPITRDLPFTLLSWRDGELVVSAPIDGHRNDKGTFFAGSTAALMTLSGWALTTLQAEDCAGEPVDVLAVENQLRYTAPLMGDMRIIARVDDDALVTFRERLQRRGRARLGVTALGQDDGGQTVSQWQGQYLARIQGSTP